MNNNLLRCFNHLVTSVLATEGSVCGIDNEFSLLGTYPYFGHQLQQRSVSLEVFPLCLIGQVGDFWECLEFKILRHVRLGFFDIKGNIGIEGVLDNLQLGCSGFEVIHPECGGLCLGGGKREWRGPVRFLFDLRSCRDLSPPT